MKRLLPLLFIALSLATTITRAADKDSLFLNLTSNEPWRVEMALKFALVNIQAGHPVTVFLNVEGVRVAAAGIPETASKSGAEMIADILAAGGKVIVCPMCLKKAGLDADSLVKGVTMGGHAVILPAMYGSSTHISY
jgi:predicted peroxiredoxin